MATNKYVGSRYVPKYFGTWNAATAYEALSIVSDGEGVYTYTSKRPVPAGTPVSNTAYWAQSGTLSESMQMGTISHVDSTKADDANIAANKLNITFASDYTMNDATEKALNLNETVQSGTYGINPSLCQNAPAELSTSADVCQLYVYVLNVNKYTQTLVCPKKGTQYVRINDGTSWSEWLMTGFTPAYATKQGAGLVQLGDGLKAENATGLTTIDHDASLVIDGQNKIGVVAASAEQLGGVKIGSGLAVTSDGLVSVSDGGNKWTSIDTSKFSFTNQQTWVNNPHVSLAKISPDENFMLIDISITITTQLQQQFYNTVKLNISGTGYGNAYQASGGGSWLQCGGARQGDLWIGDAYYITQSLYLGFLVKENSSSYGVNYSLCIPVFKL